MITLTRMASKRRDATDVARPDGDAHVVRRGYTLVSGGNRQAAHMRAISIGCETLEETD